MILDKHGSLCHLQYTDDHLIILTAGDRGNLMIIKLVLYLFEGIFGLTIYFYKTCPYIFHKVWTPTRLGALKTLICVLGPFPITYLGVPIAGS